MNKYEIKLNDGSILVAETSVTIHDIWKTIDFQFVQFVKGENSSLDSSYINIGKHIILKSKIDTISFIEEINVSSSIDKQKLPNTNQVIVDTDAYTKWVTADKTSQPKQIYFDNNQKSSITIKEDGSVQISGNGIKMSTTDTKMVALLDHIFKNWNSFSEDYKKEITEMIRLQKLNKLSKTQ